ncbi:MAG: 8-oxo-dGTP diphosphatase [Kiritimatiellae bacterium]|nr:8-oxo-dGTP diphosphatase [Kiritimatiellia bacterium]MDW8458177.1 8-oxo-dGTP diphosphatase [Verrucomicrobiota bacterium]
MVRKPIREFSEIDWDTWAPAERATLLFVIRGGNILFIRKKRGLGAGKVNGPGGRIDPGESPLECAIREVQEELRVTPVHVRPAGELLFQFADGHSIHGYVFTAADVLGEAQSTDEADPLWTPLDAIPYHEMWADDRIWLPLMIEGRPFKGRFLFDGDSMLGYELEAGTPNGSRGDHGR